MFKYFLLEQKPKCKQYSKKIINVNFYKYLFQKGKNIFLIYIKWDQSNFILKKIL